MYIFFLHLGVAYSSIAEEEFSRRRGHTDFLKCPMPTPTPDTEAASTQSPSEATPPLSSPSSPSAAETVVARATDVTNPAVVTSPAPPPSPLPQPQEPLPSPSQSVTSGPNGQHSPPQVIPPLPSQTGPPPPKTADPTNDPQNTSNHDLLLYVSDSSGRLPPPGGTLVFHGSLPFIPPAIKYFQTVRAGQRWTDMIASFLRLEEFPHLNGVSSLVPPSILVTR